MDFYSHDSYTFVAEHAHDKPFSHTVRFLRNPSALTCAAEWLKQYGERASVSDVNSAVELWENALGTVEATDPTKAQSWHLAEYLIAIAMVSRDA
jgi:hypothetical protein